MTITLVTTTEFHTLTTYLFLIVCITFDCLE